MEIPEKKYGWKEVLKENSSKLLAGILASLAVFLLLPNFNPLIFYLTNIIVEIGVGFFEAIVTSNPALFFVAIIVMLYTMVLFSMFVGFLMAGLLFILIIFIAKFIIKKLGIVLIRTKVQRWVTNITKVLGGIFGLVLFFLLSQYIFYFTLSILPIEMPSGTITLQDFAHLLVSVLITWLIFIDFFAFLLIIVCMYVPVIIIDLSYYFFRKMKGRKIYGEPSVYEYQRRVF
jgi:hypothetical protein